MGVAFLGMDAPRLGMACGALAAADDKFPPPQCSQRSACRLDWCRLVQAGPVHRLSWGWGEEEADNGGMKMIVVAGAAALLVLMALLVLTLLLVLVLPGCICLRSPVAMFTLPGCICLRFPLD